MVDNGQQDSQVRRLAAKRSGGTEPLFTEGHALTRLTRGSWSLICEALSDFDINLMFNQSSDADNPRSAFRRDYASLLGVGMNLIMPTAGAYMCYPGRNRVYLPAEVDRTLVEYLQRVGFLGEVVFHTGMEDIVAKAQASGRRVYSIDDLGDGVDDLTANTQANMVFGNSKETVFELSAYAATEVRKDMFEVTVDDFHAAHEPGRTVYLKTCNTENAGEGVFPVASVEEFDKELADIRSHTRENDLNPILVIQPEIVGDNKSFQVFLLPDSPGEVPLVALTDQLIGPDGKKYAGSINHTVTPARAEAVGAAVLDLVDRMGTCCPGSMGFVMCDYFEQADGRIVTYDPGLRPSSNTAAAMVKLWVEEATGSYASVANSPWFDFGEPGIPYAEVVARLGDYAEPDRIVERKLGVLPRGHNHIQGKSRFIVITPTAEEYAPFRAELEERIVTG